MVLNETNHPIKKLKNIYAYQHAARQSYVAHTSKDQVLILDLTMSNITFAMILGWPYDHEKTSRQVKYMAWCVSTMVLGGYNGQI